MSVVFKNTVIYVNIQPNNRMLLMLGEDNLTILKINIITFEHIYLNVQIKTTKQIESESLSF